MCRLYLAVAPVAVLTCYFAGCNMTNEPRRSIIKMNPATTDRRCVKESRNGSAGEVNLSPGPTSWLALGT